MVNSDITEIQVSPLSHDEGVVAFVSFIVFRKFKLDGIALRTCPSHKTGYRLCFPTKTCKAISMALIYPINKETYEICISAVSEQYNKVMEMLR